MRTIRLAVDSVVPLRVPPNVLDVNGNRIFFYRGDDVIWEIGFFENRTLVDLANARLYVYSTGEVVEYESDLEIATTIELNQWIAGTHEHVSIIMSALDTDIAQGSYGLSIVGIDTLANQVEYVRARLDIYDAI